MITADKIFDIMERAIRNILIKHQSGYGFAPRDTDMAHDFINEFKYAYSGKSVDAAHVPFVLDTLKELTPFVMQKVYDVDLTIDVKWKKLLENDVLIISAVWTMSLTGIQIIIQPSSCKMKITRIRNDMRLNITTCTRFTFTEDKVSMDIYQYNNIDVLNANDLDSVDKLYLISDVTILS